jgi:hypothetical protein
VIDNGNGNGNLRTINLPTLSKNQRVTIQSALIPSKYQAIFVKTLIGI